MDYSMALLIAGSVCIVGYCMYYAINTRKQAVKEIGRLRLIASEQDAKLLESSTLGRDERQRVELGILMRIKGLLTPNGVKALDFLEVVGLPQGKELDDFLVEACKLASSGGNGSKKRRRNNDHQSDQNQNQNEQQRVPLLPI